MIVEGSGEYFVFNGLHQFYFRTLTEIAEFLGVGREQVRVALYGGTSISGYCVDKRIRRGGGEDGMKSEER